jgi:hypothetical protein
MSIPLACIACSLDPQTTSLILPLAQATILAAPVILRAELRKGVQAVRSRRARRHGAESLAPSALPAAAEPCREVEVDLDR